MFPSYVVKLREDRCLFTARDSGFMPRKGESKSLTPKHAGGHLSATCLASTSLNDRCAGSVSVIWTDRMDRKLRHMYAELASAEACAALLRVPARHVRQRLRLLGLAVSSAISRGSGLNPRYRSRQLESISVRWSDEMDATLRRLREERASLSACAKELGVSDGTIRKRLDHLGLPRRVPSNGA